MLDRDGFSPNVGIVLLNHRNQVFWGKRIRTHSWQFPQGGIKYGETPEQAMYRELHEEVGLHSRPRAHRRAHARLAALRRADALHPARCARPLPGQKQIWFLLQLIGRDSDMNLRATDHPEFDAWRWNDYWIPLDVVIEFKRDVYQMALTELARFLPRSSAAQPLPAFGHAAAPPRRRSSAARATLPADAVDTDSGEATLAHTGQRRSCPGR